MNVEKQVLPNATEQEKDTAFKMEGNAALDYIANLSHELRTSMSVIIGMAELALANRSNQVQVTESLEKISTMSRFLLVQTEDVLDMMRIDSGKVKLCLESYEKERLINRVVEYAKPRCEERGLHFRLVVDHNLSDGYLADIDRTNKIFRCLLTNAISYTPRGGVVEFEIRSIPIDQGIETLQVNVRDTGVGMSGDFQKRMFEPFEREVNPFLPNSAGTGIGLAIVKRLVDLMGGKIQVKSRLGIGSDFTVTLPLEIAQKEAEEQGIEYQDNSGELLDGKYALLCEDYPSNAEITQKLLESVHMQVIIAQNGKVGVELFKESTVGYFDVVLMDIRMPVMDGIEAAKQIRSMKRPDAVIPIIAMTANVYEEDKKQSKAAGMNLHLSKPIEPETLFRAIRMVLAKKQAQP